MTDTATIGHNSAAVGEILKENPKAIYQEQGMVEQLIAAIKEEIASHPVDLSTAKGRGAIASLSASISTRKVALENAGKALTEHHRAETDKVNAVKKKIGTSMAELRDLARKPLTDWEKAEDDRKDAINTARELFANAIAGRVGPDQINAMRNQVAQTELSEDVFGDLLETAQAEQGDAIAALDAFIERQRQEEADRIELQRLRDEKAKAEQEAQAKVAKEAAEKADAERIANAEKVAAQRAADEARAKAQAEIDAANAARASAQAELDRQAAEQAKAKREEAAREADKAHRSKVMKAAKEAIIEHGGVDEESAKKIVLAITAGSVPSVTLRF